jgi:hypothetical protein
MSVRINLYSIPVLLAYLIGAGVGQAQVYEKPPAFNTTQLLGARAKGANYTIENPVRSDGLLNIYKINVGKKHYIVEGSELLRNRFYELKVLHQLDKMSTGGELVAGVGKAIVQPIEFAGKVITAPVDTIGQTISGVGSFFGRIASGVGNAGQTPEGTVSSVLGVSSAKRELAKKFNIDPYTDFIPLASRLTELAQASALGKLTITGGLAVASGGASTVISGVSTAGNIRSMIYDKTAAQVKDINRSRLKAMAINRNTVKQLLNNRNYTVTDRTIMINALEQMSSVGNRALFVSKAAHAGSRGVAFFQRKRAEYLENYHRTKKQLKTFISIGGFPLTQTHSGRILALFPLDSFAWTEKNSRIITLLTESIREKKLGKGAEFRTTGWISPLAKKMLKSQSWRISVVKGQ